MAGEMSNIQSQSQSQTITISVDSAGDPELEQRIFNKVHSAGRQLARLSAVLDVLLQVHESEPTFAATEADKRSIEQFREMQKEIAREKRAARDPERLLRELSSLQRDDPDGFASVRERLEALLRSG